MHHLSSLLLLTFSSISFTLAHRYSDLQRHLSPNASIIYNSSDFPSRWSTYNAPSPLAVVNIATENDVQVAVKYCAAHNISFLAQNGGNGWSSTFELDHIDIIISLRGLNQLTVNANRTEATIGGGITINETVNAAYEHGIQVTTGNCPCVGTLGALLGGGYGNLVGLHGMALDNVLSFRLVTASGALQTVTAHSHPDLFWGLRGAGANLGIVTSATVRAYPVPKDDPANLAWTSALVYPGTQIRAVAAAIDALRFPPEANVFLSLISASVLNASAPLAPVILVAPFLIGANASRAERIFKPLYDLRPASATPQILAYPHWGASSEASCVHDGSRRPSFGTGFQAMRPAAWQDVWDAYVAFQRLPGAEASYVVMERYNLTRAQKIGREGLPASFPWRGVEFTAIATASYRDSGLDAKAEAFGRRVREALRANDGLRGNATYINFANGDEPNEVVYGESLPRLRELKRKVDPDDRFCHWFNIEQRE